MKIAGCQPDSGNPTVRDERGAYGNVSYGGIRNPLHKLKRCMSETLCLRLRAPYFYPTKRIMRSRYSHCYPAVVLVLWLVFVPLRAAAEQFTGKVVGISDGDTLSVLREGKAVKVRLHGVDTPEKAQAFGTRARQFTSELAFQQTVTVDVRATDRYGRLVGEVRLPDGRSLNQELVRAGMAWWYRQYAPKETALAQLEADARAAKRGLWADASPVPPWEWRKQPREPSGSS